MLNNYCTQDWGKNILKMALRLRSLCCNQLLLRRLTPCLTGRTTSASTWKNEQDKFFAKNERLNRPMSPHITIYSFPLTAVLSVCHRGTGIGLYAGVAAFGLGMCVVPGDLEQTLTLVKSLSYGPALLFLTKLYIAWPFCYHTMNGVRHLMWDTGRGLSLKAMYSTGYAVIGLSILGALGLAMW